MAFKCFYVSEAEKIHAQLYREAENNVDQKKDWLLKWKVWICFVCGHAYVGDGPPVKCPVCSASRDKYIGF